MEQYTEWGLIITLYIYITVIIPILLRILLKYAKIFPIFLHIYSKLSYNYNSLSIITSRYLKFLVFPMVLLFRVGFSIPSQAFGDKMCMGSQRRFSRSRIYIYIYSRGKLIVFEIFTFGVENFYYLKYVIFRFKMKYTIYKSK